MTTEIDAEGLANAVDEAWRDYARLGDGDNMDRFVVRVVAAYLAAATRTSEAAEPVAWAVEQPLRDGTMALRLPFLTSREDADRYQAQNPDVKLVALSRAAPHPSPVSEEGTEAVAMLALIREEASKDNAPLGRSDSLALERIRSVLGLPSGGRLAAMGSTEPAPRLDATVRSGEEG